MADMIEEAAQRFYEYENTKAFVIDILNGVPTPFIEALSRDNRRPPTENARVLSKLAMKYIEESYQMLKYFGAKEGKTLEEYIHRNVRTPRRTAHYILAELKNKLSPMGYSYAVRVLLEQHMHECSVPEEFNQEPAIIEAKAA